MGAIAHETGGLLVDDGWLRILGGAGHRMVGTLANWNGLGPRPVCTANNGWWVIAHDAAGGVFALDRGALGPGGTSSTTCAPTTCSGSRSTGATPGSCSGPAPAT